MASEKNILKRKGSNKRETPCTNQTFSFHCVLFPPPHCTFLQKPEKRTWLYSSLFFSSLETRMKPELVRGESRTCRNERPVLLQEAGWCRQLQYRDTGMYLVVIRKTLGDLSQPSFKPFYRFNSISSRSKLGGPRAAVTRHGVWRAVREGAGS